jgi:uncharacterized RDD family membrane protein YckC
MANNEWEQYQVPIAPAASAAIELPSAPRSLPAVPLKASPSSSQAIAGVGARLSAKLVDNVINAVPLVGGFVMTHGAVENSQTSMVRLGFWILALLIVHATQIFLLSLRGQSLGKLAPGIRIVTDNHGRNPGFYRAVVLRGFVPSFFAAVPLFGQLFLIADFLFLFSDNHRCLHDLIADTIVVDVD